MGKKVVFLSRSDLRGGAAIVTFRLMTAMREQGVDARMLVCEKMSDSPYVDYCAPKWRIQYSFLKERFKVFVANGFDRATLFKVDPASDGLPVCNHPWVREADAIFLGWVNQGMLSLKGAERLCRLGKPVVWVMHDMWNMTGICHHAGECLRFTEECGDCPFLGKRRGACDMSHATWQRKKNLYGNGAIRFVAVSSWLAGKCRESSLLKGQPVTVVANAFPLAEDMGQRKERKPGEPVRIIFGAARLDDPIKGLPVLKEALRMVRERYPDESLQMELVTFGSVKDPANLEGFALRHRHLGIISGEEAIRKAYSDSDIVVSASDFETLPGTLIEGQAYGCIPVAFDHGGQRDIIDHESTGWLAPWNDDVASRAANLAEGIAWAADRAGDRELQERMRRSVEERFGAPSVARRMLALVESS